MSAQHTPGPWWITESGVRDRGGYICHTNPAQRYEGQEERFEKETAERAANKILIAAAPELIAACKAQHLAIDLLMARLMALDADFMPTKSNIWPAVVQGSEAIAKATSAPLTAQQLIDSHRTGDHALISDAKATRSTL